MARRPIVRLDPWMKVVNVEWGSLRLFLEVTADTFVSANQFTPPGPPFAEASGGATNLTVTGVPPILDTLPGTTVLFNDPATDEQFETPAAFVGFDFSNTEDIILRLAGERGGGFAQLFAREQHIVKQGTSPIITADVEMISFTNLEFVQPPNPEVNTISCSIVLTAPVATNDDGSAGLGLISARAKLWQLVPAVGSGFTIRLLSQLGRDTAGTFNFTVDLNTKTIR